MKVNLQLDEKLFFTDLKKENSTEVLSFMGNNLIENKYVQKEFTKSIIQREKEYPTGLSSESVSIAIPHTDHDLVNTTTLSVATLAKTVPFKNMADSDEAIDVKIVIMLAISEPEGQLEMLQKIMEIIQNKEVKEKIINAKNNIELLDIVKNEIGGK